MSPLIRALSIAYLLLAGIVAADEKPAVVKLQPGKSVEAGGELVNFEWCDDGKSVVTLTRKESGESAFRVWSTDEDGPPRITAGPRLTLSSQAISADGRLCAYAFVSDARDVWQIRLWDIATGKDVRTIEVGRAGNSAITLSRDGKLLAAGEDKRDGCVRLWNVETGATLEPLDGGKANFIQAIAFSPDGARLLSGGANTIQLWDVSRRAEIKRFLIPQRNVRALRYSSDNAHFSKQAVGDECVSLWHTASLRFWKFLGNQRFEEDIRIVDSGFTATGRYLVACGRTEVKAWLCETGKPVASAALPKGDSPAKFIRFGAKNSFAIGAEDGRITLWNLVSAE